MVKKPVPAATPPSEAEAATKLEEALARLKSATDRQAAVVGVLSRVGVSAQDKQSAQAESRRVERDLREARRMLAEAQAAVRK